MCGDKYFWNKYIHMLLHTAHVSVCKVFMLYEKFGHVTQLPEYGNSYSCVVWVHNRGKYHIYSRTSWLFFRLLHTNLGDTDTNLKSEEPRMYKKTRMLRNCIYSIPINSRSITAHLINRLYTNMCANTLREYNDNRHCVYCTN